MTIIFSVGKNSTSVESFKTSTKFQNGKMSKSNVVLNNTNSAYVRVSEDSCVSGGVTGLRHISKCQPDRLTESRNL